MFEDIIGKKINYRQLCIELNLKQKTGNSKIAQIKKLYKLYDFEKVDGKYIFYNKYEVGDIEPDKSSNSLNEVPKHKYGCIGVYCICDNDNNIYVGSTVSSFIKRFYLHYSTRNQNHTYFLLREGNGIFQILYESPVLDETIIREIEKMYIDYFLSLEEYNVINKKEETHCNTKKEPTIKFKKIMVDEERYNEAIELLSLNNIYYK